MLNKRTITLNFEEKIKALRSKIGTYLVILLIFIFSSSLIQSINRTRGIAGEVESKKRDVEKLKEEQEKLKQELVRVQSEEYIEKQLRDNLGLAKDGEITLILPEPDIVKKFAPRLEEESEILPDPNWKKWLKLFDL